MGQDENEIQLGFINISMYRNKLKYPTWIIVHQHGITETEHILDVQNLEFGSFILM